ncbi:hypothetical protein [Pantoea rwandensis]|uniref:hypothetical protein n=1 Tax=Pantoea rwandensis TaxID=1076550 RepID=UPI00142E9E25|nr:hypothetical protein [Pantoea rwandensis]
MQLERNTTRTNEKGGIDYTAVHAGKVEMLKRFLTVKTKAEQAGAFKVKPL